MSMKSCFLRLLRGLSVAALSVILSSSSLSVADNRKPAPDFELSDTMGRSYRLSDFRGKVVVLNFWATWCNECIKEIPSLNSFAEKNREKVLVLGLSSDRNPENVRAFLAKNPVRYPVLIDSAGDVFVTKYTVIALPATIIVDSNGLIAERLYGAQDFLSTEFQNKINRLLAGK